MFIPVNLQSRAVIAQNLNYTFGVQDKSAFNLFTSGLKHNDEANGFHRNITLTNGGCFALSFSSKFTGGPLCVSPPCHPAIPAQQPGGEKYNKTRCHMRKKGRGLFFTTGLDFEWNAKVRLPLLLSVTRLQINKVSWNAACEERFHPLSGIISGFSIMFAFKCTVITHASRGPK